MPEPQWATYLWNSEKGELKNRFPNRPESWKELVARSQSKKYEAIPDLLKQMPSFLLLFLLVYPHRVRPELIRVLDHSLF
jgi:ADP-heptose:LPS heptosyltransferase